MEYRGIRYALRTTIVRRQWKIAVYKTESDTVERTATGSRYEAERVAMDIIDRLLNIPKQAR